MLLAKRALLNAFSGVGTCRYNHIIGMFLFCCCTNAHVLCLQPPEVLKDGRMSAAVDVYGECEPLLQQQSTLRKRKLCQLALHLLVNAVNLNSRRNLLSQ